MFSFFKRLFAKKQTSDTLYIGNLVYSATNHDLSNAFSKFGKIENARIIRDNRTRKSKGYGFVTFHKQIAAENALREMEGFEINGRPIRVRLAHEKS